MLEDLDSADEITTQVDRLLRDADAYGRFPTPVDDIVAAAKLVQADDYVLDEKLISKLPASMRTILRGAKNKIQGLVDRRARVVHISPSIDNEGKRRFVMMHETTHDILPYQRDLLYADDHETLSPATNRLFEREANQGAAELLFQRTRFAKDAADSEISIDAIWGLASRYGSSFHAAFRRYAETYPGAVAAIVLDRTSIADDPPTWVRQECMATKAWTARFGTDQWPVRMSTLRFPFLAALAFPSLGKVEITDASGDAVAVRVDACQNGYKNFVLLWVPPRRRILPRRKIQVSQFAGI